MKWYGAHQVFVSCIEYIDSRKHFVCLVHLWRQNMNEVMIGILVPFLGTSLGSACVFFMKKNMSDYLQRALTGFAAGVCCSRQLSSLHRWENFLLCRQSWDSGLEYCFCFWWIVSFHICIGIVKKPKEFTANCRGQRCLYLQLRFTIFRREWR